MGFDHRKLLNRCYSVFHATVQGISHRTRKFASERENRLIAPEFRQRIRGILLIFLSISLGIWARNLTQMETLAAWERKHLPSLEIWSESMRAYGFLPVEKEYVKYRAIRSLPLTTDQKGASWISDDQVWVVVFLMRNGSLEPILFSRNQKDLPSQWVPLGLGWNGFEEALATIKSLPPLEKTPPKAELASKRDARPSEFHDPRAIHY